VGHKSKGTSTTETRRPAGAKSASAKPAATAKGAAKSATKATSRPVRKPARPGPKQAGTALPRTRPKRSASTAPDAAAKVAATVVRPTQPPPPAATNRRRHARSDSHQAVQLETDDGAVFEGEAHNVSDGGMFVTTDFFLPPCTIVRVKPVKPAGEADSDTDGGTSATVVRARDLGNDFGAGLWFEEPVGNDNEPKDG
jgi:hypothetical protein